MFDQIETGFRSILRQGYFAIFEREAYEAIQDGASVDDICSLYLENLKEQFGDAVTVSEDFQYEWLAVPHFYKWPFYVYAYAFGHLLVLALYEQYQQEGGDAERGKHDQRFLLGDQAGYVVDRLVPLFPHSIEVTQSSMRVPSPGPLA